MKSASRRLKLLGDNGGKREKINKKAVKMCSATIKSGGISKHKTGDRNKTRVG